MDSIILPDDQLSFLEKAFGSIVRQIGSWSSDGVFGYCSVPLCVVERAAEQLTDAVVLERILELRTAADRTRGLVCMLRDFGLPLIEAIIAAYRAAIPDGTPVGSEKQVGVVVEWQTG